MPYLFVIHARIMPNFIGIKSSLFSRWMLILTTGNGKMAMPSGKTNQVMSAVLQRFERFDREESRIHSRVARDGYPKICLAFLTEPNLNGVQNYSQGLMKEED